MNRNLTRKKHSVAPEPSSADLILRYYQILKGDQLLHINAFKNRVRYGQIIGTAVVGILAFFLKEPASSVNLSNLPLWLGIIFAVMTVTYFLIHDVLESVFAVRALDEYLSYLEERVETLGFNGLFWQTRVAQKLWPTSRKSVGFPTPEKCLGFYALILIGIVTIGIPGYVCYEAQSVLQNKGEVAAAIIIFLLLYALISLIWIFWVSWGLNTRLRSKVRSLIEEEEVETKTARSTNNPNSRIKDE